MRLALTKDLGAIRAAALARIDQEAAGRLRVLIPAPEIEAIWRRKAEAAQLVLAARGAGIDGAVSSLISAEVGTTAPDAVGVAQAILAKADALDLVLAEIEAWRIKAKAAVRPAQTIAAIELATSSQAE